MKLTLRQETPNDFFEVANVVEQAFQHVGISDQQEHFLVDRLRKSNAFVPELSIVAESNNEIIGHILLTKISIVNNSTSFESLALAPVSVLPKFQNQGIGGKLIEESHRMAKELNFKSIVLLGHENYYPKFGYELTKKYNIEIPFDAPEENCMVIELVPNGLKGVSGKVEYHSAFFE